MGFLGQLLGGGQQSQDFQDYVNRYEQGSPSEGYTDQEVMNRYHQVAPQLSQHQYMQAAEQAFNRLSPQQRAEFGQFLQQQAQHQGISLPGGGQSGSQNLQDSSFLAQTMGQLHQQPGLVNQLLGGGSGQAQASGGQSILSNPLAKAALAGIAAMAAKQFMNQRH